MPNNSYQDKLQPNARGHSTIVPIGHDEKSTVPSVEQ